MSFNHPLHVRCIQLAFAILLSSSCADEARGARTVGQRRSPLELACAATPADVLGDVTAILGSVEPLDPSQPQQYGSDECAGLVFEFDNSDEESLRGAWVQASGDSLANAEVFGEDRCPERALEVDYWGYEAGEWTQLASASTMASFETGELAGVGYCRLEALIEYEGAFEKLRIAARVTDGTDAYPMYACVW